MQYGLIFDVDGVIGDTEGLSAKATIAMFRDLYDFEPKPEDFRPFIGTGAASYVQGVAEKYGVAIDTPKAVKTRVAYFVKMLDSGVSIALPGVKALVDAGVQSPDWRIAVATSGTTEKSKAAVKASGLTPDIFDVYITGDMVTHKKPHPEIYETTGRALGLAPSRCVVIEDALNGIEAAHGAGMKCVAVTNSFSRDELAEANLVVDSLRELTLEGLRGLLD